MDKPINYSLSRGAGDSLDELLSTLAKMEATDEISDGERNVILITSYSVIVIVSLIGNLLVCKVLFAKTRRQRTGGSGLTTTNKLIANLAVSDLLMTILNIPFNIARFVLDNWPFGETLCVLVPFIQSMSVHCSSLTMMFIAIERYKSIIHNKHLNDKCFGQCLPYGRITIIIWLASAVFSIPHGIYNRVIVLDSLDEPLVRCRVAYPEPHQQFRQRLTLISFLSQYLIPILLTCGCYLRISFFLWRKGTVGEVNDNQRSTHNRRLRQRINMLIMVVTVFAVCWLPLNVFHLLTDYELITYDSLIFFTTHWLAMSSVCYNPFIYCWLNDTFKARLKSLFGCPANA